jgi:hypothetical protein
VLSKTTSLRILVFTDPNPDGINIFGVYAKGSTMYKNINYSLLVPRAEWIGVKLSDCPELHLEDLSEKDRSLAIKLKDQKWTEKYKVNGQLVDMLNSGKRSEMDHVVNSLADILCLHMGYSRPVTADDSRRFDSDGQTMASSSQSTSGDDSSLIMDWANQAEGGPRPPTALNGAEGSLDLSPIPEAPQDEGVDDGDFLGETDLYLSPGRGGWWLREVKGRMMVWNI